MRNSFETAARRTRAALDVLYQRHWGELCAYLRRTFGKGPPEPEDMVQHAFMNFAGLSDPDAVGNVRAYLYRTAHNYMVDEIRRMGAHQRAVVAFAPQTDQTRDEFTPERVLQAQERLRLLASVIRAAPDPRRSSFIQARLDGLSAAEIARRTGYSESNIKKHIMLVMRDLEAALAAAERSKVRKGSGS
jgi:RNA polymerase sigma-70 factor (ECF subfamily)